MGRSRHPEHVVANRDYWNGMADDWVEAGRAHWARAEPEWGIWNLPEHDLHMLPMSMQGMRAVELGCGTGYVSAWMHARGASVVGVDVSERQLATAKALAIEHGREIEFLHADAEATGLPSASFDFAISEYGAAIWCEPRAWLREAHRLLADGGELVFLGNSPWALVCTPPSGEATENRMRRSYFELGRLDWRDCEVDPGGIEFNLPVSGWVTLFNEIGFEIEGYLELRAPAGASGTRYFTHASWARAYPAEHVWKLRKAAHRSTAPDPEG